MDITFETFDVSEHHVEVAVSVNGNYSGSLILSPAEASVFLAAQIVARDTMTPTHYNLTVNDEQLTQFLNTHAQP